MDIPGLAEDPEMMAKAEQESERLLEELKEKVKVEVQDIGTLRKELRITVPAEVIAGHLEHNYEELKHDALVPGFRKGRAPLQLIQKRFGGEVRDSAKTAVVGQAYFAAVENNELEVLGDPLFRITIDDGVRLMDLDEALDHVKLPENEDLTYVCEVEIKPSFELPELKGIEIQAPKIEITDEDVENHILRQRKIRGRYEPLAEGAAEEDDLLVADVTVKVDDAVIKKEENVQLGVRPTRLDGIPLMDLDKALKGAKPGDQRSVECEIPDDYERADLRGKSGRFEFHVHELKRLVPVALETFVQQTGAESENQLREFVREDMVAETDQLISRAKKEQILEYLLKNTSLDLPPGVSARQIERAVARRIIELQQSGTPQSDIEARTDELRTSATEQVNRDLKLDFILDKVAEQLELTVTDEEVNTQIARMARLYNRRFDRVRDDLQKRGLLAQLAEQIRQDKCVQQLLQDAKIVEAAPKEKAKAKPKRKPKAAKKKAAAKPAAKTADEPAARPKPKARKSRKKQSE
jgi:trigger factor